jgi:hypothetical protein
VAGIGAYLLIVVFYRYVIIFVFVLLVAFFGYALVRLSAARGHAARCVAAGLFAATFLILLGQTVGQVRIDIRHQSWRQLVDNPWADAAEILHQAGLPRGAPVAEVGNSQSLYFLQVARLRVIAMVADPASFWNSSDAEKEKVYHLLAGTGAQAVVAAIPAPQVSWPGWTPIGGTGYIYHPLSHPPGNK